ncbi:unnamed protein product [Bemisia tabaci]|uniref:Uncharacterized protein n=1 Tax=Bemisia tabaci TaxID=7038 RepID=A0A9P0A3J0_BEMTA|nr:unnamed protein product [Bemisia tabaci]
MSVLERLRSEILPKAVREKKFGQNVVKFLEFKSDENYAAADQFASSIYFGDVISETESGDRVTQSVVVKAQAGASSRMQSTCSRSISSFTTSSCFTRNLTAPLSM